MEALWQWRRATSYVGDDELVFCKEDGGPVSADRWRTAFEAALEEAKVPERERLRPFHDLRHAALTNAAAAGASPIGLMTSAGHSDMGTTKKYLHMAGVVFRDEAEALERRLGTAPKLSTELSTGPSESGSSERQRKDGGKRVGV
jgi:integrase